MSWWKKEPEIKKPEPIVGTFLFATDSNKLGIVSIERSKDKTELVFRNKDNEVSSGFQRWYDLTDEMHETFIDKISKDIECVVVKGEACA